MAKKLKIKITLLVVIGLCLIGSLTLGVSYAQYMQSSTQANSNAVVVDCFNVEFQDQFEAGDSLSSSNINLTNAYPVTDAQGISLMPIPYTFKITNTCDIAASYQVNLEQLSATPKQNMAADYLKIQFNNTTYNLTDFTTTTTKLSGVEARKLYLGRLNAEDSATFTLRMWINYDATKEQVGGKAYSGKIVVTSVPNQEAGQSGGQTDEIKTINLDNQSATTPGTTNIYYYGSKFYSDNTLATEITSITIPTKTGVAENYFAGYYTESNGAGTQIINSLGTITGTVSSSTTLYAKWDVPTFAQQLRALPESTTVTQDDLSGDANMRFIGSSPNNYVYFNCSTTDPTQMSDSTCEKWRVIGVFNSNTHGVSGTDLVKIVRADKLPTGLSWDYSNTNRGTTSYKYWNNWDGAELKEFLNSNSEYYGGGTSYSYYKSSTNTATNLDISSYSIKQYQRGLIANVTWKVGGTSSSNRLPSNFYSSERGSTGANNGAYSATSNGYVALPYMSDYAYATSGGDYTRATCLGQTMYVSNNTYWRTDSSLGNNCSANSWLIQAVRSDSAYTWSLSPVLDSALCVFSVGFSNSYGAALSYDYSSYTRMVRPAVYLQSTVSCANCEESGAGKNLTPYKLTI